MRTVILLIMIGFVIAQPGASSGSHAEISPAPLLLPGNCFGLGTDLRAVYAVDLQTTSRSVAWRSEWEVHEVRLSPDGKSCAVICIHPAWQPFGITVATREGKEIKSLRDVTSSSSWSPDGRRLAYVSSVSNATKEPKPTGVWIYSLDCGIVSELTPEGASDLAWLRSDDSLYVELSGDKIVKYSPDLKSRAATDLKGLRFSPDEKYYYSDQFQGPFPVFSVATNQDVTEANEFFAKDRNRYLPPRRWISAHVLLFVILRPEEKSYLFDCESGQVREAPGVAIAFSDADKQIIVEKPDRSLEKMDVRDLRIIPQAK